MSENNYGLATQPRLAEIPAPALDYKPRQPRTYNPPIGLVGCGGIAGHHLAAYQRAGYRVVALCDRTPEKARALAAKYYPGAQVCADYRELLLRDDIEVVDVTTHPRDRVPIIRSALDAHKHVLSQKPFVVDLDVGEQLITSAAGRGVRLAVNQNGRWAPHFSYMRQAIRSGLIGEVANVSVTMNWDHTWIAGTRFKDVHHIILYDFAIHWFDIVAVCFGNRPARRIFAAVHRQPGQVLKQPMMAHAVIEFDEGQATLCFNGASTFGQSDRTVIAGTKGTLQSNGPSLMEQDVTLITAEGLARPQLEETWFTAGFHGTMSELLCAIEEKREPSNSARSVLPGLALCFAAMESADTGQPKTPGEVRRIPQLD